MDKQLKSTLSLSKSPTVRTSSDQDEAVSETTLPIHSGVRCHGPTDCCCQPMVATCLSPSKDVPQDCALDGLEAAWARGQPVQLGHQHVSQQLQRLSWLRCHMKSKVVSGTSKISCKVIHSTALYSSSGATYVFLCCSKGPEDYFGHCCSSAGHPPCGRVG